MSLPLFLFIIVFLEGYAVLSAELLAIRQLIPYVGAGTDTVSVIIAAVLMPLAFGYHAGGTFRPGRNRRGKKITVRRKLTGNITLAAAILTPGLSGVFIAAFFHALYAAGLSNGIILTALYAMLFLVWPVFLLGQTLPLLTHFFARQNLSRLAGTILFVSTLGSFMGAVFCTLFLMGTLGVSASVVITILALTVILLMLAKSKYAPAALAGALYLMVAMMMNSGYAMQRAALAFGTAVPVWPLAEEPSESAPERYADSWDIANPPEQDAPYLAFLRDNVIQPGTDKAPRDILAIGAGSFIIGHDDPAGHYIYLEIDEALKARAPFVRKDDYNKTYIPGPAARYLAKNEQRFGLIMLETFYGYEETPLHLLNRAFLELVKNRLSAGGVLIVSVYTSPNLATPLSRDIDTTLRAVFPNIGRDVAAPYNGWERDPAYLKPVLYTYHHFPYTRPRGIYTDDRNPSWHDRAHGF